MFIGIDALVITINLCSRVIGDSQPISQYVFEEYKFSYDCQGNAEV